MEIKSSALLFTCVGVCVCVHVRTITPIHTGFLRELHWECTGSKRWHWEARVSLEKDQKFNYAASIEYPQHNRNHITAHIHTHTCCGVKLSLPQNRVLDLKSDALLRKQTPCCPGCLCTYVCVFFLLCFRSDDQVGKVWRIVGCTMASAGG